MSTIPSKFSNHKLKYFTYDQAWFSLHREPTFLNPPDIAAENEEISRLSASVELFESADPGFLNVHYLAMARRFRELCRWRLFSINSLPDDLILHIFKQGTFCSPDDESAPIMPLTYSSVCKRWRDLALDASWLWGFLGFADHSPYVLTNLFLERSRFSPLLIEIDLTDRKFDYEDDTSWPTEQNMVDRLAMLLPHIHRWRTFHCCTDNWAPLYGVLSTLEHKAAPILKRIELRQNFDALLAEVRPPRNHFDLLGGGAPALREFKLYAVPFNWHHRSFSNLTELSLSRLSDDAMPTLQDFLELLHQSPNLRKFALVGGGPQWDEDTARRVPAVELLCLEELEILGTEFSGTDPEPYPPSYPLNYAIFVMELFVTGPALQSLGIGAFPKSGDPQWALPLIRGHFPCIKRLLLADMDFDVVTAAQWLHAMPEVSYLTVTGSRTEVSILEALASSAHRFSLGTAEEVFLPSLTTLSVHSPNVETVHNLVHTRLASGAPIKSLMFDINLPGMAEALGSLRGIVDFGFEGTLYDSEDEWIGPDPSEWSMDSQE